MVKHKGQQPVTSLHDLNRSDLLELVRVAGLRGLGKIPVARLRESLVRLDLSSLSRDQLRSMASVCRIAVARSAPRTALIGALRRIFTPEAREGGRQASAPAASDLLQAPASSPFGSSALFGESAVDSAALGLSQDLMQGQMVVFRSKFSPSDSAWPVEEEEPLLERYGVDQIGLMVRDPHCLFVYWELTDALAGRARSAGAAEPVMRVYDVTGLDPEVPDFHTFFDLFRGDSRSWYLRIPEDGRSYVVEVGAVDSDGRFVPLLRSNAVEAPPAGVAPDGEGYFATVRFDRPLMEAVESMPPAFRRLRRTRLRGAQSHLRTRRALPVAGRLSRASGLWPVGASLTHYPAGAGLNPLTSAASSSPAAQDSRLLSDHIRIGWRREGKTLLIEGAVVGAAALQINGSRVPLAPTGRFWHSILFPEGVLGDPLVAHSGWEGNCLQVSIAFPRVATAPDP